MDWLSEEGQKLLESAFPNRFLKRKWILTVGGWVVRTGKGRASCTKKYDDGYNEQIDSGSKQWQTVKSAGALFPDPTHPATFLTLIKEAMDLLKKDRSDEEAALALWSILEHEDQAWALVSVLGQEGGVDK